MSILDKIRRRPATEPPQRLRGPLALLNTSIATTPGEYRIIDLADPVAPGQQYDKEAARRRAVSLARDYVGSSDGGASPVVSYVGHQATADAFTEILVESGVVVDVNREQYVQQVGDQALVLKLRGRLPEGVILDRAALEACGYDLWLMERKG